jgi:hypothetical protein
MAGSTSSWFSDLGAIAGLIGATAWLAPWVYQKFTKPSIEGRLISKFENAGKFKETDCLMHFLALNLISLDKEFNIKETNISVKYKDSPDTYSGSLFWARANEWAGPKDERLSLNILPEQSLPFLNSLPKNTTVKVYLTFSVDKAKLEEFEKITITFVEHSKHESKLVINSNDIISDQMLWDDRIWDLVPPNKQIQPTQKTRG